MLTERDAYRKYGNPYYDIADVQEIIYRGTLHDSHGRPIQGEALRARMKEMIQCLYEENKRLRADLHNFTTTRPLDDFIDDLQDSFEKIVDKHKGTYRGR